MKIRRKPLALPAGFAVGPSGTAAGTASQPEPEPATASAPGALLAAVSSPGENLEEMSA